jgi:hypothetical protein
MDEGTRTALPYSRDGIESLNLPYPLCTAPPEPSVQDDNILDLRMWIVDCGLWIVDCGGSGGTEVVVRTSRTVPLDEPGDDGTGHINTIDNNDNNNIGR